MWLKIDRRELFLDSCGPTWSCSLFIATSGGGLYVIWDFFFPCIPSSKEEDKSCFCFLHLLLPALGQFALALAVVLVAALENDLDLRCPGSFVPLLVRVLVRVPAGESSSDATVPLASCSPSERCDWITAFRLFRATAGSLTSNMIFSRQTLSLWIIVSWVLLQRYIWACSSLSNLEHHVLDYYNVRTYSTLLALAT